MTARILPVVFMTLIVLAVFLLHCAAAGSDRHGAHSCQGDWMTYLISGGFKGGKGGANAPPFGG